MQSETVLRLSRHAILLPSSYNLLLTLTLVIRARISNMGLSLSFSFSLSPPPLPLTFPSCLSVSISLSFLSTSIQNAFIRETATVLFFLHLPWGRSLLLFLSFSFSCLFVWSSRLSGPGRLPDDVRERVGTFHLCFHHGIPLRASTQ